jgi:PhoU domain
MLRMANRIHVMLDAILPAVLDGRRSDLSDVDAMDEEVDALHGHIIAYLGDISQTRLSDAETDEMVALMEVTNDLESIGDIVETNLISLGFSRLDQELVVSDATRKVLDEFEPAVEEPSTWHRPHGHSRRCPRTAVTSSGFGREPQRWSETDSLARHPDRDVGAGRQTDAASSISCSPSDAVPSDARFPRAVRGRRRAWRSGTTARPRRS